MIFWGIIIRWRYDNNNNRIRTIGEKVAVLVFF